MKDNKERISSRPLESSDQVGQRESQNGKSEKELHKLQVETHEFQEGVEGIVGKEISEVSGEDKNGIGDYSSEGSGDAKAQVQDIKAHLLENLPPPRVMVREVRQKLIQEQQEVIKETRKAEKNKDYHLLNGLFAKLRDISEKLSDLRSASAEYLKKIWLKVVHGITT